jgi:16S rRNA (cytosine1402-N4)-methyltransferase
MPAPYEHIPVLYVPVLEALQPRAGGRYVDATVGLGGHATGILERSAPDGHLLGLDLDPQALAIAGERLASFGPRATLVHADYTALEALAGANGFLPAQGVLFDLGVSSLQVDRPERGFSFLADAPLDMRFDATAGLTAADLLNDLDEAALADILWRYGEERLSRRIARRIVQVRSRERIARTGQLARLVEEVAGGQRGRIHPATRTFQALRIAVNRELERLPQGLEQATRVLAPGGRLVVISFHSLEDRIVKTFIQQEEGRCDWPARAPLEGCPHLARAGQRPCRAQTGYQCGKPARLKAVGKAGRPVEEEVERNPRARSARMRVAERIAAPT